MKIVDLEIALNHDDLTEIRGGFFFAFPLYLSSVSTKSYTYRAGKKVRLKKSDDELVIR